MTHIRNEIHCVLCAILRGCIHDLLKERSDENTKVNETKKQKNKTNLLYTS